MRYPSAPGLHPARTRHFDGLHGVFADSLPDSWGRMLLQRRLARQGISLHALNPVDILALVGTAGRGALIYQPATRHDHPDGPLDLDALAAESSTLQDGKDSDLIDLLVALGGGSGGAKPKVHVGLDGDRPVIGGDGELPDNYAPWIVKFRAAHDPEDIGPIEIAYAALAMDAGLEMSDCRLIPSKRGPGYFATRRFDRGPGAEHCLDVDGEAKRPTMDHLRTLGQRHGLRDGAIQDIIDAVRAAIARWPEVAGQYGVTRRSRDDIQPFLTG